jgi:hypothetical protein
VPVHTRITSEERAYVDALVTILSRRGLTARAQRGAIVGVENRAACPDENDRVAQALYPGLRQEIACAPLNGTGPLWWHWVWSGPTRDAPSEWEPLVPIGELTAAADRIATVLALRPEDQS